MARGKTRILALLLVLLSPAQSAHPHPTSGGSGGVGRTQEEVGGPFEYSYGYPTGVNGTNATTLGEIYNTSNAATLGNSTGTAEADANVRPGLMVDSAAIPYAGSVSFLYRNRRQKRRNLRQRFLHGSE